MYTIEKIIQMTQEAIKESGKSFDKIPQDSILEFLKQNGITDSNTRVSIFKKLKEMNSSQPIRESKVESKTTSPKSDIPVKQPRKSVFGEIKRIA